MKLNYSNLAYSALMALIAVVIGVAVVLAIVGLSFAAAAHPFAAMVILVVVIFVAAWADAYDHIS